MLGRTTIICGFQTNFRTMIFYGNNTIFRTQYMREVNFLQTEISGKYQRFFIDSKQISAHCLWQEEQQLFADS
jgi:hypothetical protein